MEERLNDENPSPRDLSLVPGQSAQFVGFYSSDSAELPFDRLSEEVKCGDGFSSSSMSLTGQSTIESKPQTVLRLLRS